MTKPDSLSSGDNRYDGPLLTDKKNALYLSVNVFSRKVLIGDTILCHRHFMWSSEPRKSLGACSAERVPSFLSYFKTLSIAPDVGIEPATSCSAVTRSTI